jgi:hypothetical protein
MYITHRKVRTFFKVDTLLKYLNKSGYAGGLGWQYQQDAGDSWMKGFSTFGHSIAQAYRADSNDIKISGISNNTFAVMVSATNGGQLRLVPLAGWTQPRQIQLQLLH